MAKNLVIVESPAKSKTLNRFLGKDFETLSTVGHIVDLPKSSLGVDTDNDFAPDYTTIKGKEKVIAELKKAAKKAKKVYLAPDPDREGEAIAWHVANSLKGTKTELVRVTFNEITKDAVRKAIETPREIDMNLVNAQQARRVLDRLVGYRVSPFLWKTIARNLSAGRVQSVALRLVCEREAEIKGFVEQEYWQIKTDMVTAGKKTFQATLVKIGDKTIIKPGETNTTKMVIESKAQADKITKDLKKQTFAVTEVKNSKKQRKPYAPFITSSLQQEAAKVYGFSPRQTMSTAQKLYEGIELGAEGPTGLITYMRTDSTRVSTEAVKAARDIIKTDYGKEFLPAKPNVYSKKKSAQDAHEAIRPTYVDLTPEKVKKHLTPQQFKLYSLIWKRFVSSQMANAQFATQSVNIEGGKYTLRATAQKMLFEGFLRLYQEETENGNKANGNGVEALPELKKGDDLTLKKVTPNQSFTKPPGRYSEAMLVKRLEADGIGRPSTYANIIATIRERKYVELENKKLHPTELGDAVNKILVDNFPKIFSVSFTAAMEKELDNVEEGRDNWVDVVRDCYEPVMVALEALKGKESSIKKSLTEKTDEACENCGKPMEIKWGRNGRFMSCSGYPDCKTTKSLPEE
ncbi:MAG: type I DNA topoisomerase, partial [Deltaproteobacteria bacterium]|nr:type I DNA topoisomerase [Deltaproteobacteria bacterium]